MNNLGALTKLVENLGNDIQSNEKLIISLSIFIGLNIILTGLNIFFQFKLKNKEKEINGHSLREQGRIEHQELLYQMLEDLTKYDGNEKTSKAYIKKTTEINHFLTSKRIYLSNETITIANDFKDYFLSIISDYRQRKFETELNYLEAYCKAFNNVKS